MKGQWRPRLTRFSEIVHSDKSTIHVKGTLNCLVIPGDHLLDIRSMWKEISQLDCIIRYLGFNEGHGSQEEGTQIQVSNNAVTSLLGVVHDSQVIRDPFEAVGNRNSQAYQHLRKYGPYHVVNLDLCSSFFPNKESSVAQRYAALQSLLTYQFAEQATLWLLFITTLVKPSAIDGLGLHTLCKPTHKNLQESSRFAEKLEGLIPKSAWDKTADKTIDLSSLSETQLIDLFGVALGKWLLNMGQTASPRWIVNMRRSYKYSISKTNGSVMLSLAFELTPNFAPPIDTTGMTGTTEATKKFPTEEDCAVQLAQSVAHIRDADALSEGTELKNALCTDAGELMEASGFDKIEFMKWVDSGEPDDQSDT